jgi:hypothetical protein
MIRKLALCLVLVPMLVSAGVCLFFLMPRDRGLVFECLHKDIGELDYRTQVTVSFLFRNTSRRLVHIRKVVPSCNCLSATASEDRIRSGGTGTIHVTFRSSYRSGAENHRVAVLTDSPAPSSRILSISALVNPDVELIPRAISFGAVVRVQDVAPRSVAIVSRSSRPARILGIRCRVPYLAAVLLDTKPAYAKEIGRICVALSGCPPHGDFRQLVDITVQTEKGVVTKSLVVFGTFVEGAGSRSSFHPRP